MMLYDESNYTQLLRRSSTEDGSPQWYPRTSVCGTVEAASMGLVPLADYPDLLPDVADFKGIIQHCHYYKIFPMYWMDTCGAFDNGWNQKSWGYCWTYGLTASVIGRRAVENKPTKRLSPFSLGWLVNWKNSGYYCDRAIDGARERGIAMTEYVPEWTTNQNEFKSGWQENAMLHRPLEWWDTEKRNDLQMLQQLLAILMTGTPGYIAYDWWGHALAAVGLEWDETQPNNVVVVDFNSHDDGFIRIAGSRAVPDELYGVRATACTDE